MDCGISRTRKRPDARARKLSKWFLLWIDGYTLKQLHETTGYAKSHLQKILASELKRDPFERSDLSKYKYLVFDGKYLFGRDYCLLVIYDALTNKPIVATVAKAENRACILPWLTRLKSQGLNPVAVTTDGRQAGIYAFQDTWESVRIQRCLFHIKLQVTAWARIPPRTELGKDLTTYVNRLFVVHEKKDATQFMDGYLAILGKHEDTISKLNRNNILDADLIRAVSVIKHALPNLFHYLDDSHIAKTTSGLEGYFKQVQDVRGFRHSGLTEEHLFDFLKWKIYFDSQDGKTHF